jgi:hypothetical protein
MRPPDTDVSTSHEGYPETVAADQSEDKQKFCIKSCKLLSLLTTQMNRQLSGQKDAKTNKES